MVGERIITRIYAVVLAGWPFCQFSGCYRLHARRVGKWFLCDTHATGVERMGREAR